MCMLIEALPLADLRRIFICTFLLRLLFLCCSPSLRVSFPKGTFVLSWKYIYLDLFFGLAACLLLL